MEDEKTKPLWPESVSVGLKVISDATAEKPKTVFLSSKSMPIARSQRGSHFPPTPAFVFDAQNDFLPYCCFVVYC